MVLKFHHHNKFKALLKKAPTREFFLSIASPGHRDIYTLYLCKHFQISQLAFSYMISIDKIFILSFAPNNERIKESFEERLKTIPLAQETPLEIYALPQEDQIDESLLKHNLQLYESWRLQQDTASPDWKEISLAIGHWSVWEKARQEKNQSILVLEEDFLPQSSHYHVLNTVQPWELIYFGRIANGGDIPVEGGLVNPGYSNGAFAYALSASGLTKLVQSGYDRHMIPTGEFLTAMYGAHPAKDITALYRGFLTALAPMKNFISKDKSWTSTENPKIDEAESYQPLHSQLYECTGNTESKWIMKYLNLQLVQKEFDLICDEPIDNVYSFPLFTPLFCKEIIEEAEHYGQWTSYRGKDQAPIDIRLNSIGFNEIYSRILKEYVYPLICYKYQLHGDAWMKLNSQNFIVRYLSEKQGHLGLHNDGSYLSMIVTLNTDYEGGGTIFPKFKKLIKHDQPGYASVHPGLIGYLHGARPVTKRKRYILASFFFPGSKPPITEGAY